LSNYSFKSFKYIYFLKLDEFKFKTSNIEINKTITTEKAKNVLFLIVDDEALIRSAIIRIIVKELKASNECFNLRIVEASDGVECLLAMYLHNNNNIKFDALISDETMPYISGMHLSKIIFDLVSKGAIQEINMFISTARTDINIINNYSNIVKKVYPKPIDANAVKDLLKYIK